MSWNNTKLFLWLIPLIWRSGIVPFLYCMIGITKNCLYQNRSPIKVSFPGMQHLALIVLYNTVMTTTFLHFLYDLTVSIFIFCLHLIKCMMWMRCSLLIFPWQQFGSTLQYNQHQIFCQLCWRLRRYYFNQLPPPSHKFPLFFFYSLRFSITNVNSANHIPRYLMSVVYL
jgi:hypothetical protein